MPDSYHFSYFLRSSRPYHVYASHLREPLRAPSPPSVFRTCPRPHGTGCAIVPPKVLVRQLYGAPELGPDQRARVADPRWAWSHWVGACFVYKERLILPVCTVHWCGANLAGLLAMFAPLLASDQKRTQMCPGNSAEKSGCCELRPHRAVRPGILTSNIALAALISTVTSWQSLVSGKNAAPCSDVCVALLPTRYADPLNNRAIAL